MDFVNFFPDIHNMHRKHFYGNTEIENYKFKGICVFIGIMKNSPVYMTTLLIWRVVWG